MYSLNHLLLFIVVVVLLLLLPLLWLALFLCLTLSVCIFLIRFANLVICRVFCCCYMYARHECGTKLTKVQTTVYVSPCKLRMHNKQTNENKNKTNAQNQVTIALITKWMLKLLKIQLCIAWMVGILLWLEHWHNDQWRRTYTINCSKCDCFDWSFVPVFLSKISSGPVASSIR